MPNKKIQHDRGMLFGICVIMKLRCKCWLFFKCSGQNKFINNYWQWFSKLHSCVGRRLKNNAVINFKTVRMI